MLLLALSDLTRLGTTVFINIFYIISIVCPFVRLYSFFFCGHFYLVNCGFLSPTFWETVPRPNPASTGLAVKSEHDHQSARRHF